MNFYFNRSFSRSPCTLSGQRHYVAPSSRERMRVALEDGCRCNHDEPRTASLVMRNGAPWLQCDACGSSLGSAMPKADHPKCSEYPHWRVDLVKYFEDARAEWDATRPTPADRDAEREEAYRARAREYEVWCRTSPEWKAIRDRIFWRSRGHCEACLSGNADVVHHLTYQAGVLPPAWHLRAVCASCHERLHTRGDEWCEWGMAR